MKASFGRELAAWMTGNYTDDRSIAASSSSNADDDVGVHHNCTHSPDGELGMASSESPAAWPAT